jgi:DsbC/DsbD-like thiol-disulfide interchange protein
LRMEHAPHWHTYWRNPGDSGFATSVEWVLPEEFTAKPLQYAAPEWIPSQGLVTFGYEGTATHVATLQPPADLKPGSTVRIGGQVSWLECNEVCIPGGGDLFIDLTVASAPGRTIEAFREAERGLPWTPREWTARARLEGESLIVSVSVPEVGRQPAENMHFFPEAQGLADLPSLSVSATADGYEIRARLNPARESTPEAVAGLLVGGSPWAGSPGRHAARISAPLSQAGSGDL